MELVLAIRAEHVQLTSESNHQSISVAVEFIDDMGADKFIRARCINNGEQLNLRVSADQVIPSGQFEVELPKMKLHVFNQQTGQRIGEWRE
jgi:sn-glycerol 3-phosphate transport system ATP-binding protein